MDINLIGFEDWLQRYDEGGAQRRRVRDAFERGTLPPIAPASVNSGGTGSPLAQKNAAKVKTDVDMRHAKKKGRKKKK